jgi:hypothetical protein
VNAAIQRGAAEPERWANRSVTGAPLGVVMGKEYLEKSTVPTRTCRPAS